MAISRICLRHQINAFMQASKFSTRAPLPRQLYLRQQSKRCVATWSPLGSAFNVRAERKLDASQHNVLACFKKFSTRAPLPRQLYLRQQSKRCVATWSPLGSAFNVRAERKLDANQHNVGLFEMSDLTSPEGFAVAQQKSESEADELVRQAVASPTSPEIVQIFDKLSDALCKVADLADFVRIAHPDAKFCEAAEEACRNVTVLVERLNTCPELYQSLKRLCDDKKTISSLDEESKIVAESMLADFEKSGIHLDIAKREEFVRLNEEALILGNHFMQGTEMYREIRKEHLPEHMRYLFTVDGDSVQIGHLYNDSSNDMQREAAFKIYLYPDPGQNQVLNRLLEARHNLATLVGFDSFAQRALQGTMAGTPEKVMELLTKTADQLLDRVSKEIELMKAAKRKVHPNNTEIYPWDPSYYMSAAKQDRYNIEDAKYHEYFSLGSCMEGLNMIFDKLYGIQLVSVEPHNGEVWAPDVQKLAVKHETDGVLGYIYCDFFDRPNKSTQDCQFTIRGGKQLDDGSYQLPRVALNCRISPLSEPGRNGPILLSHSCLENVFHEFGHAMHGVLARTHYQHASGTRCVTDFSEVPSILMEYFANDPRVLRKFARHYRTNEIIPEDTVERLLASKKMFSAYELQQSICHAIIDQLYHDKWPLKKSTTDLLYDVQKQYSSLPPVSNTAWQLRFNHLVTYAAKYYSYLYSKALAARIWHEVFAADPLSRSAGDRYRHQMLAYGGGKNATEMVTNMLGKRLTTDDLVQSLLDHVDGIKPKP